MYNNGEDILLKDLTSDFIDQFEDYVRDFRKKRYNGAIKHCLNIKRILDKAVEDGKIESNPFKHYNSKYEDVPPVYLDENYLHTLIKSKIKKPEHLLVRDLFLFQCYTGIGFDAMLHLNAADIIEDDKGRKCNLQLKHPSDLVKVVPLVPMLPQAIAILEKYTHSSPEDVFKPTFPALKLYDYNKYLKQVAFFACINKKLNSLVARATFSKISETVV